MTSVADPAKTASTIASVVAALGFRVERAADDGRVTRVTVLGLPLWDETFRGVQRRRARREARRRDSR